jgi:hypothetical protein
MIRKLMAAFAAAFLCGTAFAAGARLFNSTDFVSRVREAASLGPEEARRVALLRTQLDYFKTVQVTKINLASLGSGAITLVLLNGTEIEYSGAVVWSGQVPVSDIKSGKSEVIQVTRWAGTSASGGRVSIAHDKDGLSGQIHEQGKNFRLFSLPGKRFFVLTEVTPPPMRDETYMPPAPVLPPPPNVPNR